ncbi:MAG: hypothetical protein LCH59_13710 [Proteobacteria bacterium]|nr:hypothetical protein [Pseudomonadota bacterium]
MGDSNDEHARDSIYRVKRGLCGYVSYLAACEMNQAFSEYVLYEPILRIITSRGYNVSCEHVCPGIDQPRIGDKKRLDFYAEKPDSTFAMEVKWLTSTQINVAKDTEKLQSFRRAIPDSLAFLLVFGRQTHIKRVDFDADIYKEWGTPVYADLRKTKYGCRVFRING